MDFGIGLFTIVATLALLYYATRSNKKINVERESRPIEPIETIEEEPQTTFTKKELTEAIEKGITEAKKKDTDSFGVKMMKGGCAIMAFQFAVVWLIVIGIIAYILYGFI